MKDVAVFFGGVSVEHDVSVITGLITVNSFFSEGYNPVPVYIDGEGKWFSGESLKNIENYKDGNFADADRVALFGGGNVLYRIKGKKVKPLCVISAAVNCLHGERGEDGSLAGYLNMCGIPLASPQIFASSVCMDKAATKIFLKGLKVKSLPCITVKNIPDYEKIEKEIGYPVIVKPATGGSSIGVNKARDRKELQSAVSEALRYCDRAVVEKCLENFTEINCAAYRNSKGAVIVSECEKPSGKTEILSFEDKYMSGKREFPADIPAAKSASIKRTCEKVYRALGAEGVIRFDFMAEGKNVYLNEINTVPGSLAYYLFSASTKEFGKMIEDIVKRAERKFAAESSVIKKFNSSVLFIKGAKSAKRL